MKKKKLVYKAIKQEFKRILKMFKKGEVKIDGVNHTANIIDLQHIENGKIRTRIWSGKAKFVLEYTNKKKNKEYIDLINNKNTVEFKIKRG